MRKRGRGLRKGGRGLMKEGRRLRKRGRWSEGRRSKGAKGKESDERVDLETSLG